MRDLMRFRAPIAEDIFLHSSLLHVVIWWSLRRPYTENCYLLLSCMSSVSARKKWKQETNIYFSFVLFLYLTSLSTQQDCVLPVVFRRDVEFCVKNREKRRKALWGRVSLRLVDWSSGYFSVMERNSTGSGGGGVTSLYGLYRYVQPQREWFFSRFGLKLGIDFTHFALK